MFVIEIPAITVDENIIKSVKWQVSTINNFNNNLLIDKDKQDNKFMLEVNYPLTNKDIYYVRYKYYFTDNTEGEWSRVIEVTDETKGYDNSDFHTVIITPKLETSVDVNSVPLDDFIVTSSPYTLFTGVSKHQYTNWIITTLNNEVIYEVKNSKTQLTSFRIPKGKLKPNRTYLIKAQYVAENNIKSYYGKLIVNTINITDNRTLDRNGDIIQLNSDIESYLFSINANMYKLINKALEEEME